MQTVILVLIEILIVIGLSRLVGLGFRWIKQPLVIGEIVAGKLIQSLEPQETRQQVHSIVRIANDVARTTAQIAEIDRANLIMMGWHRPAFSTNRLGGRVGQILTHAKVDVAVFMDRGRERLETLLVPYAANLHDDLGLELALRLLVNGKMRSLTVLRVVQNQGAPTELSNEFHTLMEQLPSSVRDRIDIQIVGSAEPIQALSQRNLPHSKNLHRKSRRTNIDAKDYRYN